MTRRTAAATLPGTPPRLRVPPEVSDVRASFLQLAERFVPAEARGVDVAYVVELDDGAAYTIQVADGRCLVSPGEPAEHDARLRTDPATWLDIVAGRVDGIRAFTTGRLRVRGDLQQAVQLETMFSRGPEATRELRTRTTAVKGTQIASWVGGQGVPVVLIHGLAASKVTFVPTLDDLADDHHVHAIDLPGFGRSGKPLPAGRRYTPGWFADRLVEYLDAHGLDDAHLVGNSMGGRIATEVALRYPERVRGVVGLGAAVAFDEWQPARPLLKLVRWQWAAGVPVRVPSSLLERGVAEMFHDPSRVPAENIRAAVDEARLYLRDPGYRMAVAASTRGLVTDRTYGRRGFWDRLAGLRVPSLWLYGRSDPLVSHRYGRRVADVLPGAEVEVWDDLGHVPQFELPGRTHALVRRFLDRTEAGR
jgi:pimeloyl-ACP methyl ester carboxylesterase/putative sterol carrier protein